MNTERSMDAERGGAPGPTPDLSALDARHVWHPFTQAQTAPAPGLVQRGEREYLYLEGGEVLRDLVSSWWVNLHGHGHPVMAAAVARQAAQLEQVIFAGYTHEPAVRLAAALSARLGLQRVFYSDNGSTAVEVALKLALQTQANRGEGQRRRVLALDGAYHGDTFGAMSAGRSSGFYAPFSDKLFEVLTLPVPQTWDGDPDVAAKEAAALGELDRLLEQYGPELAALIAEPLLQGSSGMRVYRPVFLEAVVRRVRAAGALVIFDEVLTGFGRTGRLWAADQLAPDCRADLVCLSKGLTGGFLPLGVTAASEDIYSSFLGDHFERAFAHGHSFTANPISCAAALASLELLESEAPDHIARIGAAHAQAASRLAAHPGLTRVRQLGTLLACDLVGGAGYGSELSLELRAFFRARGLLLRPLGSTLYLLPPYCTAPDSLEAGYSALLAAADRFA